MTSALSTNFLCGAILCLDSIHPTPFRRNLDILAVSPRSSSGGDRSPAAVIQSQPAWRSQPHSARYEKSPSETLTGGAESTQASNSSRKPPRSGPRPGTGPRRHSEGVPNKNPGEGVRSLPILDLVSAGLVVPTSAVGGGEGVESAVLPRLPGRGKRRGRRSNLLHEEPHPWHPGHERR